MGKPPPQLCIRFDGSSGKEGRRHTTPERADKRNGTGKFVRRVLIDAVLSFLAFEVTQMAAPVVGQKLQGAAWRKYWLTRAPRGHAIMVLIRCSPLSAG